MLMNLTGLALQRIHRPTTLQLRPSEEIFKLHFLQACLTLYLLAVLSVKVSATYKNSDIKTAIVRPETLGIVPRKTRHTVAFTLTKPYNIFLQVNGNVFDGLHLFTNQIEDAVPSKDSPDVIYYGPGLHKISGNVDVASGQTVYVAGGAVVTTGGFNLPNTTNISIRGRGVLLASSRAEIPVAHSRNITLEGFIGINVLPRTYAAKNVVIKKVRAISSVQWGDGIDIFCSNNILMDHLFLRTSDDSVAIYNRRWQWYGGTTNITLQNSALWAGVAHPINIGTHGNPESPETTDGVLIRNVDILDHREGQILF
ncbi:pectin lyase fold/virulence factor [Thelonectria olida]|uniref:Pectin lyase fold/virulence factor n=1 Tax=Thelonectria olida TaxID=1576542 RepID=A0A9P8VZT7_9HYPO|nr:pectin lyase fold/virulence factor [Thelonectria olida]